MIRIRQITALGVSLVALAACAGAPRARAGGQGSIIAGNPAPSPEQIQSLITRAIANQHRDDRALEEFERIEHTITRKAENAEIITDLTLQMNRARQAEITQEIMEVVAGAEGVS